MANPEHLDILKQGVEVWNEWRKTSSKIKADLSASDFHDAKLLGANLKYSDFSKANFEKANIDKTMIGRTSFSEANLYKVNCRHAKLRIVDLSQANLQKSNLLGTRVFGTNMMEAQLNGATLVSTHFRKVSMQGSIFCETKLIKTVFDNCNLKNANLTVANIGRTTFIDCDLSKTIGLETLTHTHPSDISINTFYRSKGNIPEIFLKKAGVPEDFLIVRKSLINQTIEFFSCFISFTEKDDVFSEQLYNDMLFKNVRCWRWKEDAKWGDTLRKSIDEAVRVYDKLVVICSKDSLHSPPVLEEIEKALNKEDTQIRSGKDGEVLFPIAIDNYIFDGWDHYLKDRLLRKTIGDFKGWKRNPEKYIKSVERLVKDLNKHS